MYVTALEASAPKRAAAFDWKPAPLIVTTAEPAAPLDGLKPVMRGFTVKLSLVVEPPAFVTPIGPVIAAGGTVVFSFVALTMLKDAETGPAAPANFTEVVPPNVLPVSVTTVLAGPLVGESGDATVGRTPSGVAEVKAPARLASMIFPVTAASGTTNVAWVAEAGVHTTGVDPTFAAVTWLRLKPSTETV